MHSNAHSSSTYDNQEWEATYMSRETGMDKEEEEHIQNGILLSHKKRTK